MSNFADEFILNIRNDTKIYIYLVTKTTPSNETLECCIDLCHNSEQCQERLERFFFPSRMLIEKKKQF